MKSNVFPPHGQRVPASSRIFDSRYSSQAVVDSEINLVREGCVSYPGKDLPVEYLLVFHRSFKCYELTIFAQEPKNGEGWARFYFPDSVVKSAIPEEELRKLLLEQKEFYRRRHRHFSPDHLEKMIKYEKVGKLIEEMVVSFLHYEMFQRLLVYPSDAKEKLLDIFGDSVIFQSYDQKVVELLMPKPEYLIPVNTQAHLQGEVEKKFLQYDLFRQRLHGIVERFKIPDLSGAEGTKDGSRLNVNSTVEESPSLKQLDESKVPKRKRLSSTFQRLRSSFSATFGSQKSSRIAIASTADAAADDLTHTVQVPVHQRIGSFLANSMRQSKKQNQREQHNILDSQAKAMQAVIAATATKEQTTCSNTNAVVYETDAQRHLRIRRRWILAIRRVISQIAVQRTKARLNEIADDSSLNSHAQPPSTFAATDNHVDAVISTDQHPQLSPPGAIDSTTNRRHSSKQLVRTNDVATLTAIRKEQKAIHGSGVLSHIQQHHRPPLTVTVQHSNNNLLSDPPSPTAVTSLTSPRMAVGMENFKASSATSVTVSSGAMNRPSALGHKAVFASPMAISNILRQTSEGGSLNHDFPVAPLSSLSSPSLLPTTVSPDVSGCSSLLSASYVQHQHQLHQSSEVGSAGGPTVCMRKFVSQYPLAHQQSQPHHPHQPARASLVRPIPHAPST